MLTTLALAGMNWSSVRIGVLIHHIILPEFPTTRMRTEGVRSAVLPPPLAPNRLAMLPFLCGCFAAHVTSKTRSRSVDGLSAQESLIASAVKASAKLTAFLMTTLCNLGTATSAITISAETHQDYFIGVSSPLRIHNFAQDKKNEKRKRQDWR